MPIEVDVDERLREIGEATLEIADAEGVSGISYRSVAKALGGSTKLVTKYLPTRTELLANAIRIAQARWKADSDRVIAAAPPGGRVRAIALWSCTTDTGDLAIRKLNVEILSSHEVPQTVVEALSKTAVRHLDALREAAVLDGYEQPEQVADAIFLATYGYFVSTLRDLGAWTEPRAAAAVEAILSAAPRRARPKRRARAGGSSSGSRGAGGS